MRPAWLLLAALTACTINSAKKHYVLGEKLWSDGNYNAAVSEFEKAYDQDPRGNIGLQALFRAATTQSLFLSQYQEAYEKLQTFVQTSADESAKWDADKQSGEILYSKLEKYDRASQLYEKLLKDRPDSPEAPEFLFRVAKSQFFLKNFDQAKVDFSLLLKKYPDTPAAENAAYELGMTLFTQAEQHPGSAGTEIYQRAMDAFERFQKKYPASRLVPDARFGIASCLEEMDQLDAAYHIYEGLKSTYPSPKVIEIKLARIRERKSQRNH